MNKLENDKEVSDLLEKIPMLKARVHLCRNELTKLCNFVDSAYGLKKFGDTDINLEIALPFKNTFFKHSAEDKEDDNLFNLKHNRGYK